MQFVYSKTTNPLPFALKNDTEKFFETLLHICHNVEICEVVERLNLR